MPEQPEKFSESLTYGRQYILIVGCGGCCRKRRDLVLSGYDLYRIARRLYLPPRVVAQAFCKSYIAPQSCLPALRLTPSPETGDCRFLEGGACVIHEARPLACALYPLGQCIDPDTGAILRLANPKYPQDYLSALEKVLSQKGEIPPFFSAG